MFGARPTAVRSIGMICGIVLGVAGMLPASAAAKTEPTLYGFGSNSNGMLGDGLNVSSDVPVKAEVSGEVKQVAAGSYFGIALLKNGTVETWGSNVYDELGDGLTFEEEAQTLVPHPVPGLSGVVAIAAGANHALALLSSGHVEAWGDGNEGELGDGSEADLPAPVTVAGLTEVKAIAAGGESNLALLENGTVMSWGYNSHGQLGDGSTLSADFPVRVGELKSVKAIAEGAFFGLAVVKGGAVASWGAGGDGELGDGAETDSDIPVPVSTIKGVKTVAAGGYQAYALLTNKTVQSWGLNNEGQLGQGVSPFSSDVPVPVTGLGGVKAIAAGSAQGLAVLSTKKAVAWGQNEFGELGDGTLENSDFPTPVINITGVKVIGSGTTAAFGFVGT